MIKPVNQCRIRGHSYLVLLVIIEITINIAIITTAVINPDKSLIINITINIAIITLSLIHI